MMPDLSQLKSRLWNCYSGCCS